MAELTPKEANISAPIKLFSARASITCHSHNFYVYDLITVKPSEKNITLPKPRKYIRNIVQVPVSIFPLSDFFDPTY